MGGGIGKQVRSNVSHYNNLVESVKQNVKVGLSMHDEKELRILFEQHCDADQMLTKNKLNGMFPFKAANAFNVDIKPDREEKLNFQNFLQLMQAESSIQKWTASLPICKIYADALTAVSSSDRDPLKAISTITNEELNAACDGCMDAIKGILADELRKLKAGFLLMDEKSHCQNESAVKFQVFTMSCGHIEDFHKGLIGRIGCLFPLNKNNFYL